MREYLINLAGCNYLFRFQEGELYVHVNAPEPWQRCARINLHCGRSVTDEEIRACIIGKYQVQLEEL